MGVGAWRGAEGHTILFKGQYLAPHACIAHGDEGAHTSTIFISYNKPGDDILTRGSSSRSQCIGLSSPSPYMVFSLSLCGGLGLVTPWGTRPGLRHLAAVRVRLCTGGEAACERLQLSPFWRGRLADLVKPAAVALVPNLSSANALCFENMAKTSSKRKCATGSRTPAALPLDRAIAVVLTPEGPARSAATLGARSSTSPTSRSKSGPTRCC